MNSARTTYLWPIALVLPLYFATPAFPKDEIKLSGTAALDQESCAKGTGSPDCIMIFSVTGKAAKVLYDGMTNKGSMQECTGNVEKFDDSGLHCIQGKDANGYICDFAYAFKKHRFDNGQDGC